MEECFDDGYGRSERERVGQRLDRRCTDGLPGGGAMAYGDFPDTTTDAHHTVTRTYLNPSGGTGVENLQTA